MYVSGLCKMLWKMYISICKYLMIDINKRCLMRKEEENGNIMYYVF